MECILNTSFNKSINRLKNIKERPERASNGKKLEPNYDPSLQQRVQESYASQMMKINKQQINVDKQLLNQQAQNRLLTA